MKQIDVTFNSSSDSTRICPHCNKRIEDSTGGKIPPKNGDITVCLYCRGLCIFEGTNTRLVINKLSDEKLQEIIVKQPDMETEIKAAKEFVELLHSLGLIKPQDNIQVEDNTEQEEFFESEWFLTRPEYLREFIKEYPPAYYKFKDSGKECYIIGYEESFENPVKENITIIVQKTGKGGPMAEMGLGMLDTNQVFGVKPESLIKIE